MEQYYIPDDDLIALMDEMEEEAALIAVGEQYDPDEQEEEAPMIVDSPSPSQIGGGGGPIAEGTDTSSYLSIYFYT